jgi:hypothetical protein
MFTEGLLHDYDQLLSCLMGFSKGCYKTAKFHQVLESEAWRKVTLGAGGFVF